LPRGGEVVSRMPKIMEVEPDRQARHLHHRRPIDRSPQVSRPHERIPGARDHDRFLLFGYELVQMLPQHHKSRTRECDGPPLTFGGPRR